MIEDESSLNDFVYCVLCILGFGMIGIMYKQFKVYCVLCIMSWVLFIMFYIIFFVWNFIDQVLFSLWLN